MVGKHGGAAGFLISAGQQVRKVVAIKDVVAQHQRAGRVAQERFPDQESLRQAIGRRLNGVLQVEPPLCAVAQQLLETRRVLRRADDQDVAHAPEHESAQRVIDHGLVIHRQQLLAHGQGGRVQPRAGAAGEDDAFALGHGMGSRLKRLRQHARHARLPGGQGQAEGGLQLARVEARIQGAARGGGIGAGGDGAGDAGLQGGRSERFIFDSCPRLIPRWLEPYLHTHTSWFRRWP